MINKLVKNLQSVVSATARQHSTVRDIIRRETTAQFFIKVFI